MERKEYEKLNDVEDEMWWFNGLHANLLNFFLLSNSSKPRGVILDAGCGTGGLLRKLARAIPHNSIIGLDIDEAACRFARAKSARPVCRGAIDALPFTDGKLAAILSADVLCHESVDDERALRDFHRCLAANGVVILNLPAYQWLMSGHDRAVHTARRYTRKRVRSLLQDAGFVNIRTTYWNTILFPLMLVSRALNQRTGESDVRKFPVLLEFAFRGVMRLEIWLLKRGVFFPYGGSILATATRP